MSVSMTLYDYTIGISIGIGNIGVAFPEALSVLSLVFVLILVLATFICPCFGSSWYFFTTYIGRCVGIGFGSPWCCLPLDFA